jgi:hypothetical protein
MIKPYQVTKESRYLGLPLGFGFLGATYALSSFIYFQPYLFGQSTIYFQLLVRNIAFIFLCLTYYFSRKNAESTKFLWDITFGGLIAAMLAIFLVLNIPGISLPAYDITSVISRCFNVACAFYLCAHTLRSHLESSSPETIWSPIGYILFGISQYALVLFAFDTSYSAFFSGLAIRYAGLAVFLYVSYKSFYSIKKEKETGNEKNRS